ncbi:hypothetical protein D3C83_221420 [compost metagenome]
MRSDDKRRMRLNLISQLLDLVPYKKVPREKVRLPDRSEKGAYNDAKPMKKRRWIPERY